MSNTPKIPRPPSIDPSTLNSFHCPSCRTSAFTMVYQFLDLPRSLAALTPGSKPGPMPMELLMCVGCGGVFHSSQLSIMTPREREIARVEAEIKHEGGKGN